MASWRDVPLVGPAAGRAYGSAKYAFEEPGYRAALRGRLLAPYWRRRFHSFGREVTLDRPNWLYKPGLISIDDYTMILRGAWLAVERPAWGSTEPVLKIGKHVGIRTGVTISAAESIVIEDYAGIAGGCTILDSSHTHAASDRHDETGLHLSALHNPIETAPVRIGRGSWLGDRVTVLMGSQIGAHCTIGSNSLVRGDIPDYAIAIGVPARVVGSNR